MIKSILTNALGRVNQFATVVEVRKNDNRTYNPTTDKMGSGYESFTAEVIFQKEYTTAVTTAPTEWEWERGDEVRFDNKRLYVSDAAVKARAVVSLKFGVSNDRS